MSSNRWVKGDMMGLLIPEDSHALAQGGTDFLTRALRAAGTLDDDNCVTAITQFEECSGGSTGRKLLLSVEYKNSAAQLHKELFVKFSRDFDDVIRDRLKDQLEPEVRLAIVSQEPAFPIAVPTCLFADYHRASGSGMLITERIPFGTNGYEALLEKCLDYQLRDNALEHYRAIIDALATLAGTQKSGRLGDKTATLFAFNADSQSINQPIRYNVDKLQNRLEKYAHFADQFPQLLPENIRSPEFIAQLSQDIPRFMQHESRIKRFLHANPDLIALIHWNANIDNAWFWRNANGHLECGLMDWGSVCQMNLGLALWGALSAAETTLWDDHLDELLRLFMDRFYQCGGPRLTLSEFKLHLQLSVAMMGLAWLMDAPALVLAQLPELDVVTSRVDPAFKANEMARTQLHMLTTYLNLWQSHDFGKVLDHFLNGH